MSEPKITTTVEPLRVALIVGSVRKPRFADVLIAWLQEELATESWLTLDVVDLARLAPDDFPMHGVTPGGRPSPISDRLHAADAFIILTPEYNHSFPAALKHAIDWHFDEWARKPVTFVAYGASSAGIRAIEQLRLVFPELRAMTTRNVVALSSPWEHLDGTGRRFCATEPIRAGLAATMTELQWWASALRKARSDTMAAA